MDMPGHRMLVRNRCYGVIIDLRFDVFHRTQHVRVFDLEM